MLLNESKLTQISNQLVTKLLAENSEFRHQVVKNSIARNSSSNIAGINWSEKYRCGLESSSKSAQLPTSIVVNHARQVGHPSGSSRNGQPTPNSQLSSNVFLQRKLDGKMAEFLKELDNLSTCLCALLKGCGKLSLDYVLPLSEDLPQSLGHGSVASTSRPPQPSSADSRMLYAVELQMQRLSSKLSSLSWELSSLQRKTQLIQEMLPIVRALSRFTRILGVRLIKSTDTWPSTSTTDLWTNKSSNLHNLSHIASSISDWLGLLLQQIRSAVSGSALNAFNQVYLQFDSRIVSALREQDERARWMLQERVQKLMIERAKKDVGSSIHQRKRGLVKMRFSNGPKGVLIASNLRAQHPPVRSMPSLPKKIPGEAVRVKSAPTRSVSFERTNRPCSSSRSVPAHSYSDLPLNHHQKPKQIFSRYGSVISDPLLADVMDDVVEELANDISSGNLKFSLDQ